MSFKIESKIDRFLDKFEKMVMETNTLDLATSMKYILGIQFLERLET